MSETQHITSGNETWEQIAKRHGISESELRAANLNQSNFNPQAMLLEGTELTIPEKSNQDIVVDQGGNVVEVDRSKWADWNVIQGHPDANNIISYNPATGEYILRSGQRISRDQLAGEVLNDGFVGEQIYEPPPDPVELEAIPALFLAESEADVMQQYWYTQQVGRSLEVARGMSFQDLYERNNLQNTEPFDQAKAEQLFIQKEIIPTLLALYKDLPRNLPNDIDWNAYPELNSDFYASFLEGRDVHVPYSQRTHHSGRLVPLHLDPARLAGQELNAQDFINQLIQEQGWTGAMATVSQLIDLNDSWGMGYGSAPEIDIYTNSALMSQYTFFQQWSQGFDYGNAYQQGAPLPFPAYIPSQDELMGQIYTGMGGYGTSMLDPNDPYAWWRSAMSLHADWIQFQNPWNSLEVAQQLTDGLDIDLSTPFWRDIYAEQMLIAELGTLEDVSVEDIAQYLSTFLDTHPEMTSMFDNGLNDQQWAIINAATTYVDGIETIEQVEILTLDEDPEWQALLGEIQALPSRILGVPLGDVKSAFANISHETVDASEVAEGVIDINAQEAQAIQDAEQTRRELLDMALIAASFASGAASYQIGLALLELSATGNPIGLAAEALPYGLDNFGALFRGAGSVNQIIDQRYLVDEMSRGSHFLEIPIGQMPPARNILSNSEGITWFQNKFPTLTNIVGRNLLERNLMYQGDIAPYNMTQLLFQDIVQLRGARYDVIKRVLTEIEENADLYPNAFADLLGIRVVPSGTPYPISKQGLFAAFGARVPIEGGGYQLWFAEDLMRTGGININDSTINATGSFIFPNRTIMRGDHYYSSPNQRHISLEGLSAHESGHVIDLLFRNNPNANHIIDQFIIENEKLLSIYTPSSFYSNDGYWGDDGWYAEFKRVIELPRPLTEWDANILPVAEVAYPYIRREVLADMYAATRIIEQYNRGDLPHLTQEMIVEIQTLTQNFQEVLDQLNQISQN